MKNLKSQNPNEIVTRALLKDEFRKEWVLVKRLLTKSKDEMFELIKGHRQDFNKEIKVFEFYTKFLLDQLEDKYDRMDLRIGRIEGKLDRLDSKSDKLSNKIDKLDEKVERIDERLGRLEGKFDRLVEVVHKLSNEFVEFRKFTQENIELLTKGYGIILDRTDNLTKEQSEINFQLNSHENRLKTVENKFKN